MVVEECGPGLCGLSTTRARARRHVATNRSRRDRQPELETELRGNTLLTPRAIGGSHFGDQPLEFDRNPRPTTRP